VARGETVAVQGGGKEVHAGDVAKAINLLCQAPSDVVTGGIFNCCDRYVSQHEVATIAKELSGSKASIEGTPSQPKNQIVSNRLKALGFQFGGTERLRNTIAEILKSK